MSRSGQMHLAGERTEEAYTVLPQNALPDSAFYIPRDSWWPPTRKPENTVLPSILADLWSSSGFWGVTLCVTESSVVTFHSWILVFCWQKTGRDSASSIPSHCCSNKESMTPDRCYSHLLLRRAEGKATASLSRLCFITPQVGNLLCNMEPEYSLLQIKLNSCWPFPDSYRGPFYSLVSLLHSLHSGKCITSPFVSSPPEKQTLFYQPFFVGYVF